MPVSQLEDPGETISALKAGDRKAFEGIYLGYAPKLLAFTRKFILRQEDAEEVVQEVFLKIWERRHFLDPEQNFDGYLFRIARNIIYNKARHQVYQTAYGKYLAGKEKAEENATENELHYQELSQILESSYAALPPVRRQVFLMSRVEGLSNGEIAERLQTSTSNVENHINKALRQIRSELARSKVNYLLVLALLS